jgi:GNAT superfamily N-acetyltransferase
MDEREAPQRVRLSGLQEVQLEALAGVEQRCAAQHYEVGFDGAEVSPRSALELAKLPRDHDVYVAEADHVVAGYLAWRDEPPGVAYIAELMVDPDYQRFGVATRLVERLFETARENGLHCVIVRRFQRAPWAVAFYDRLGFRPIDGDAIFAARTWLEERAASGRPVTRPGEDVLWMPIPKAAPVDEEDTA